MLRTGTFAALLAAGLTPAAAQSWGFGVEVGPPIYYEYAEPQYYYEPAPPIYYEAPPIIVGPPRDRVLHMEAPELVLDRLDDAGYTELSPMARRGTLYKLSAVAPDGDLVALEISIFTGDIEREYTLEPAVRAVAPPKRTRTVVAPPPPKRKPAPQVAAAPPPPPAAAAAAPSPAPAPDAPSTLRDRLQSAPAAPEEPESDEEDPLVVY